MTLIDKIKEIPHKNLFFLGFTIVVIFLSLSYWQLNSYYDDKSNLQKLTTNTLETIQIVDINLFNDGFVLPHSSIFSYIVFFGAIPVSLFLIYIMYSIFKNAHFNNYKFFILLYLLINYIKSDSLLYLSNFILFYYFVYFQEKNVLKRETK